jgi:hypothetical protein
VLDDLDQPLDSSEFCFVGGRLHFCGGRLHFCGRRLHFCGGRLHFCGGRRVGLRCVDEEFGFFSCRFDALRFG